MLTMSVEEAFPVGVLVCSLDVKGALDNVNCDILMNKLRAMSFPHSIVILVSFLTHERNVTFVASNFYTIARKLFKGLHQGTVLSPLLYLIYVKDITVGLNPSIQISQLADDIPI